MRVDLTVKEGSSLDEDDNNLEGESSEKGQDGSALEAVSRKRKGETTF